MSESVVGIYKTLDEAEAAVHQLAQSQFPINQVSIVSSGLQSEKDIHGYVTQGDVAKTGAGTGAWMGGIFGLLVGAAFLWVPGVGPLIVAGPLAAALMGGAEGAAVGAGAGGLLGALGGWGVKKQHILKYEDAVKADQYLVVAHGTSADVSHAQSILATTASTSLETHQG